MIMLISVLINYRMQSGITETSKEAVAILLACTRILVNRGGVKWSDSRLILKIQLRKLTEGLNIV